MTTTLTARGPEDLLAAVPVVLGFHPQDSLVMLTFGAVRSFHARVDLPPSADDAARSPRSSTRCWRRAGRTRSTTWRSSSTPPTPRWRRGSQRRWCPRSSPPASASSTCCAPTTARWCSVPIRAGAERAAAGAVRRHAATRSPPRRSSRAGSPTPAARSCAATVAPVDRAPAAVGRADRARCRTPGPGGRRAGRATSWPAGSTAGETPDDDGGRAACSRAVARVEVRDAALYAVDARDRRATTSASGPTLLRGAPDAQVPDAAAVTAFCAWQAGRRRAGLVRARPLLRGRPRPPAGPRAWPSAWPRAVPPDGVGGGGRRATAARPALSGPVRRFPAAAAPRP